MRDGRDRVDWRVVGTLALFAVYALGVSGLEVCAYRLRGEFAVAAARVWVGSGLVFLLYSLYAVWLTFRRDARERSPWGYIAVLGVAAVCFWNIQSFEYFFNGEAAHQIGDALLYWAEADLRYTGCGHYCYPARQYFLASIPAHFVGRTAVGLRLGYPWLFFLGSLLFYAGLRAHLRESANSGVLSAVALLSLLTFPYVVFFIRDAEQILAPISFTLAATGWYLLWLAEPAVLPTFCLSWIVAMLGTSYTPALASWALAIAMLGLTIVARLRAGRRRDAVLLFCVLVVVVTFCLCSFWTRTDIQIRLYQERRGSLANIWTQIKGGYEVFLRLSPQRWEGQQFMSPLWLAPLCVYLATSLIGLSGVAHFVVAVWSLGVVAAAVYLQGYSVAGPAREMHRAMVIIPPLLAGSVVVAGRLLERWRLPLKWVAPLLLLPLLVSASANFTHAHRTYFDRVNRYLFEGLRNALAVAGDAGVRAAPVDLYIFSRTMDYNMRDYVAFFLPNLKRFSLDWQRCVQDFDPGRAALIFFEGDACAAQLRELMAARPGFREVPSTRGLQGVLFLPPRPEAR
jgi:hypothetical protein